MKEQTRKKVNVLGIDVAVMRPEKAVNITMNYITRKEMSTVFFHTASSSLLCQEEEEAAACLDSCNLVLAGDQYMDLALAHKVSAQKELAGNNLYADDYLKRLLSRLDRDQREIFVIVPREDHLQLLEEYIRLTYPNISVDGAVIGEGTEADIESVVNDINGIIPDIVFLCLPAEQQIHLLCNYRAMMNTHLIICIETMQPLILPESEKIPSWIRLLHLQGLYLWFKKESKLQEKIIASVFRKSVLDETGEDASHKIKKEEEE